MNTAELIESVFENCQNVEKRVFFVTLPVPKHALAKG